MRKVYTLALVACFLIISSGVGWVSASTGRNMVGMNATSQDQTGISLTAMKDIQKTYADKIIPLMDALEAKFMELDAIQHLASTTKEDVAKVIKEITELKIKLRSEMKVLSEEMKSKGINPRAGHAYCMEEMHPGMMHGHGSRGRCPMFDSPKGDGMQWMEYRGHNMPHMRGQKHMQGNAPSVAPNSGK